jgi:arylsulfatase
MAARRNPREARLSRKARRRFCAGVLAAALLALGCPAKPATPRVALFILLDAARADRLSAYGYERTTTPRLDALARRGALFRRHFTHGTVTRTTIPSLIYSRYFAPPVFPFSPEIPLSRPEELLLDLDSEAISVSRALAREGIHTCAMSAHSWMRPGVRFADEFDEFHDLTAELGYLPEYSYPRAEQVTDYAIDWLKSNRDGRVFLYLHLMDTHFPHLFDNDSKAFATTPDLVERVAGRFNANGRPIDRSRALVGEEREYLDALYDGSLRYADRHVGRLLDHLEATGLLDESLIVVTSDHGDHLLEVPSRFEHGAEWYDAVARVPLIFFYPPRIRPTVVDSLTEAVDVVPTVLDLYDIALPAGKQTDGSSLMPLLAGESTARHAVVSALGVRTASFKLVLSEESLDRSERALARGATLRPGDLRGELYEVEKDPLETKDLWSTHETLVEDLLAIYSQRLSPSYRRFVAARNTVPPTSAFAIAARDFRLQPEDSFHDVGTRPNAKIYPRARVWQWVRHWQGCRLIGSPKASTTQVSFPLPDGEYLLSAAIRGTCQLRAGDSSLVTVSARPLEMGAPAWQTISTDMVSFGRVRVVGDLFRAQLTPGKTDACHIRFFGFDPVDGRESEEEIDQEEYEQRLRALGYLD